MKNTALVISVTALILSLASLILTIAAVWKWLKMGRTSTQVKARYNKKAYKQFNVQIKPELFDRIAAYCNKRHLSRSEFLQKAIEQLSED